MKNTLYLRRGKKRNEERREEKIDPPKEKST